jgi:DNA transformation protein
MLKKNEFVEHVVETMRGFGPVTSKPMFGGWGLYHEGTFFALIAMNTLYLKVDDENRADFDALGLAPFVYESRQGEKTIMTYHQAPEEALETPAVMVEWARSAYGAALRVVSARKSKARKITPA